MAVYERRPTLVSVSASQRRRTRVAQRTHERSAAKVFTGLSVTGVTTSAPKSIFTDPVEFLLVNEGMIEVYAAFQGTIGAGNTMDLNAVIDGGVDLRFIRWTGSVTNQTRYSAPADAGTNVAFDGVTSTRGGYQVRSQDLAAGYHSLQFRFTVSGGTGSASSGRIAYRLSS
ncbi:MAG: hypothetical protein EBR82_79055 [Caulobacteraceae bacterium]|nr:hypothetical protein [Caulobacteraceae bacterium]